MSTRFKKNGDKLI